jgi:hypothetical protein
MFAAIPLCEWHVRGSLSAAVIDVNHVDSGVIHAHRMMFLSEGDRASQSPDFPTVLRSRNDCTFIKSHEMVSIFEVEVIQPFVSPNHVSNFLCNKMLRVRLYLEIDLVALGPNFTTS